MKQLWEIFWSFFKIGLFTFGGGYAMIPLIQREVIDHRKWIPASEFLDLLTLAQSVPGPIAINTGRLRRIQTLGAPRRLRIAAGRRAAVVPHHPGDRPLLRGHPSEPRRRCSLQRNAPGGRCPDHRSAGHPHAGHALEHDRAGRRTGRTDLVAGSFTGTDSCRRCRCRHRLGIVYRKKSKQ